MLPPGVSMGGVLTEFLDKGGAQAVRIDRFSLSRL